MLPAKAAPFSGIGWHNELAFYSTPLQYTLHQSYLRREAGDQTVLAFAVSQNNMALGERKSEAAIALQFETEERSSDLVDQLGYLYQNAVEPFASILANHETNLLDETGGVIRQLIWSTETEAADKLVTVASDLARARTEADSLQADSNDDRLTRLDRLIASLFWFVRSIDERRRLGVAPPAGSDISGSIFDLVADLAACATYESHGHSDQARA